MLLQTQCHAFNRQLLQFIMIIINYTCLINRQTDWCEHIKGCRTQKNNRLRLPQTLQILLLAGYSISYGINRYVTLRQDRISPLESFARFFQKCAHTHHLPQKHQVSTGYPACYHCKCFTYWMVIGS